MNNEQLVNMLSEPCENNGKTILWESHKIRNEKIREEKS